MMSTENAIYRTGLELMLAYPNTQEEYMALREYHKNTLYYTWPDSHPKNILVNEKGECAFIDFGFVHKGDQRFTLPNFLALIVVYTLGGYISSADAHTYVKDCVAAYVEIEPIDEKMFCQYLAMEVLHRSYGKWIDGITSMDQKVKLITFGLQVFDMKIETIDGLVALL